MQTDYTNMSGLAATKSVKGGIVDDEYLFIESRVSAAAIDFGMGVVIASTGKVALPSTTGDAFQGVAVQNAHVPTKNATGTAYYAINDAIGVMRKGRVWVYTETAVDPTAVVYLRCTANTGPTRSPGNFMGTDDSGKTITVTGAKWASVTTGAGLAILELNLPA